MTVGAQQPQVLAPVVAPVAVDVVDLQRHGFATPVGAGAAVSTFFRYADLMQCSTQQTGSRALLPVVAHEDFLGIPDTCRTRLSTLMRLPQEM